jgi:hypothetical protein
MALSCAAVIGVRTGALTADFAIAATEGVVSDVLCSMMSTEPTMAIAITVETIVNVDRIFIAVIIATLTTG